MSPKLLAAAARLVSLHGPQGFTMDDLARAAKVSRATLYRQAGSREEVLDALSAAGAEVGDRADARARIFAAARAVFGRTGFDGTTIEEIAAQANVGSATVYRHFGDKDGLVAAFIDEFSPRKAAKAVSDAPTGDLRRDLENLATRLLVGMQKDESLIRLMLIETLRGSTTLPRVRALSPTRTLGSIVGLLRPHANRLRSADVPALAESFAGLLMSAGVLRPLLGGNPLGDPIATARSVTDLFLYGALVPKARK
jgi:AcrR family transcriptional regulator